MPARKRDASPPVQPPAERPAQPKSEPVARRGGYVDRGDGNGWVLEDKGK